MKKVTFADRLRYAFDNTLAKGTPALIAWLFAVSLLMILFFSILVWIAGALPDEAEGNFFQLVWMSLMRSIDSGTMGGDKGLYSIFMLGLTFGGIFIVSTLIGVINSGIERRIEQLRKGRSMVVEKNHTVILGWSEHIYSIISELVIANKNQRYSCIVIMGDMDKVEMDEAVRSHAGPTGRTRIVCRTGSPSDINDLEIAGVDMARSIIVVSPRDEDPDAEVLKTLLALTNNPKRKREPYHIVAEIRDPKNMDIAAIVGKDEVELVLVGDLIARIIAQTSRQAGLSVVYTELLDFGGDEIYFKEEPSLAGKTFREALFMYEDSAVIGIAPRGGKSHLNPPMGRIIAEGDRLIVISEDDDTIKPSEMKEFNIAGDMISPGSVSISEPESLLIMGWNWRAPIIIKELDNYVAQGSSVTVVADIAPEEKESIAKRLAGFNKKQTIKLMAADTTDRSVLNRLNVQTYSHIIILCYSDTLSMQQADARTLKTLLHLRDISEKTGNELSVISEMMDVKNRDLAQVARVNDFIVSDKLISLLMAQVSENKQLNGVFIDLFDPEGSELYLKPVADYIVPGSEVNFYTILEAAARRNEIAIGYKIAADAYREELSFGVVVNPDKSKKVSFASGDMVILLAES
ncbi:MAG: potassium transporter TrkA [Spirochaetes bacterium]|nr:MAG: potassium transporter TrkA [Spirochaetota bacterium]